MVKKENNIYLISMIAIVAIVGIVAMTMNYSGSSSPAVYDEEGNLVGEAFKSIKPIGTITPQPIEQRYAFATWECYDGLSQYKNNTCKTADVWRSEADSFCTGHCANNTNISVINISFSLSDICNSNSTNDSLVSKEYTRATWLCSNMNNYVSNSYSRCLSTTEWEEIAESYCINNSVVKCGVNSFMISEPCNRLSPKASLSR